MTHGPTARALALAVIVVVAGLAIGGKDGAAGEGREGLALRWVARTSGEPSALLADRRGVVALAEDGTVTAFDRAGAEQWKASTGTGRAVLFHVLPAVGAGLVVVPAAEEHVVALDRASGAERWRAPFEGVTSTGVGTDPSGDPVVAMANRAGTLVVLDGRTGAVRWSAHLPEFGLSSWTHLWFGEGRLLAQWTPTSKGSRLLAFDVSAGEPVWDRHMTAASLPSVARGSVYFAEVVGGTTRRNDVEVRSLDLVTGAEQWVTRFSSRSVYFTSAASAVRGGTFAIVDLHGEVRVLSSADGTQRWKHATRRLQYEADLRIAGGVVAMSTYGTGLVALSTRDGDPISTAPIGRAQTQVGIEATAAEGDALYLSVSKNGERPDEGEVWAFKAGR